MLALQKVGFEITTILPTVDFGGQKISSQKPKSDEWCQEITDKIGAESTKVMFVCTVSSLNDFTKLLDSI